METPVRGDVVWADFKFSDLTGSKIRPALVLCGLPGNDFMLCMITSKEPVFGPCIKLVSLDFSGVPLPLVPSYIRPLKMAAMDISTIVGHLTRVRDDVIAQALKEIQDTFK